MPKKCGCPNIKVKDYEKKQFVWDRYFIEKPVKLFFHMPRNISKVIESAVAEAKKYGFRPSRHLMLQKDGMFRGKVMVEVPKPKRANKKLRHLHCNVLSRVLVGPFKKLNTRINMLEADAKNKNLKVKNIYFWYTTCPQCTKDFNKYKTVVFAEVG